MKVSTTEKITLFGFHSVLTRLKSESSSIDIIFLDKNRKDKRIMSILSFANEKKVKVELVSNEKLKSLCVEKKTQGVIAFARKRVLSETLEELLQNFKTTNFEFYPTLVFLDGVTDPRNLGAIIRTADSVKVGAIVAPLNHSAPLNDLAINTACGATEFIPYIRVSNICRAIETVQNIGYQVIGMDTDGNKDVFSTDLKQSNTFIFGDEGVGLKKITKEFCDQIVKLPMYGRVESLNVSVACAISLYEDYRQKK